MRRILTVLRRKRQAQETQPLTCHTATHARLRLLCQAACKSERPTRHALPGNRDALVAHWQTPISAACARSLFPGSCVELCAGQARPPVAHRLVSFCPHNKTRRCSWCLGLTGLTQAGSLYAMHRKRQCTVDHVLVDYVICQLASKLFAAYLQSSTTLLCLPLELQPSTSV